MAVIYIDKSIFCQHLKSLAPTTSMTHEQLKRNYKIKVKTPKSTPSKLKCRNFTKVSNCLLFLISYQYY